MTPFLLLWLADSATEATYLLSSTSSTAKTFIITIDPIEALPIVSISASEDRIIEGEAATFEVSADQQDVNDISVHYTISEINGSFLAPNESVTGTVLLELSRSTQIAGITIQTDNDSVDELAGEIEVTLTTEQSLPHTYTVSPSQSADSVTIEDNDIPEIVATAPTQIDEGEIIQFAFSSNIERSQSVIIGYQISDGNSNFLPDSSEIVNTITLNAGNVAETTTLNITTIDDLIDEADGEIVLTILANLISPPAFTIAPENESITVTVKDNDVPELTLSGGEAITEGGSAIFSISANIARENNIQVSYEISENSGNFVLANVDTTQLELVAGDADSSTGLYVFTTNDNVDQANGRIGVSLQPDNNSPATYTLADDNSSASVIVQDDDIPEISIEGVGDVNEGDDAQFIVSSNIARSKSIDIMYTIVAESGNFLPASHNVVEKVTLDLGDETETVTIAVATQADEIDEDNGAIEVTLQPDNRDPIQYLVSETTGSGIVAVIDDDLPVISVSSQGKVSEGSGIIFTIRSNIERDHPIRIRYKLVDQAGNIQNRLVEPDLIPFISTTTQPTFAINSFATPSPVSTVLLGAGDSEVTTTVIIPVPQDSTLENFDQLTLSIEPDDSYERSSSAGSETVIIENILVPVISIQGVGSVNEGESANFTISADIARDDSITVYYSVSSGLFDTTSDRIELAAGDTEIKAQVTVEVPDNEIYDASDFVKVELLDDVSAKYQVNPLLNESSIEVLNNDVPQISIAGEGAVTEGENARFIVRANIARQENLIIDYRVSNHSGDFLSPRQPRSDTL